MTIPVYPQTTRPWSELPVSTAPADPVMVWVLTITPETEAGEDRRSLSHNARYARWLSRQPGILGVSWSRTAVDTVLDLVGGEATAVRICLDRVARVGPVSWFATDNPSEWDWAQPSAERLAREALVAGKRHQCQKHDFCICAARGNEWDSDVIVERGFILGAGARR